MILAFATTPLTTKLAHRYSIMDQPLQVAGSHKSHAHAIPYLGGIAITIGTCGGALLLLHPSSQSDLTIARGLVGLTAALVLAAIGFLDDLHSLPRILRLATQIGAAVGAWAAGFRVESALPVEIDFLITMLWIVGITNAFNLLDNMDGLSSGIAAVAAVTFSVMGILGGLSEVAIVAGAVAGASLGFLSHNRHPAKVYMGDAGSLFLGFALALIGIKLRFENLITVTFLVPVVVLGLPIFDTTLVVLNRWRNGRPIFLGGRDHVSHRLVRVGLPIRATVGLLYFAAVCLGWLGLAISRSNVQVGWMLLGLVIALGLFFGVLLWSVPIYEDVDSAEADPQDSDIASRA